MGEIRLPQFPQGDIKLEWDPNDAASTAKAEQEFNDLMGGKAMAFYTFDPADANKAGSIVQKFDPALGFILAKPRTAGG